MKLKERFKNRIGSPDAPVGEQKPKGKIRSARDRLKQRLSDGQRLCCFAGAGLFNGLVLAMLCRCIEKQSLLAGFAALGTGGLWLTALFIGLVGLSLSLLTKQLLVGAIPTMLVTVIISLVNYYKTSMTATPMSISDFSLISSAGDIAALNAEAITISAVTVIIVVLAILWLAVQGVLSRIFAVPWLTSAPFFMLSLLLTLLLYLVGADSVIFRPLGVDGDMAMEQSVVNEKCCGPLLGLWRSWLCQANDTASESYSAEDMEQVLSEVTALTEEKTPEESADGTETEEDYANAVHPNIILVLSESFFDVSSLPNVEFEEDPVEDFHKAEEEGVSGTFYTRSMGYGTCNIELEVLTGFNTGLLKGQDPSSFDPEVFGNVTAVPELLRENGYRTCFLHTYNDSIYNRTELFEYIGFDEMYFSGDFAEFYEPLQNCNYYARMAKFISGKYYSDDLMADLIISRYEQQQEEDPDQPILLYAATMENHQPYADKYPEDEITVDYTTDVKLSAEADNNLANIAQGIHNASEMLGKLMEYFSEVDEPTVIIFYGDHRPGSGLTGGGYLWSELGMVPDNMAKWSLEDFALCYSTDYVIWANDESLLPEAAGTTKDTSCNYFGTEVLDAANVEEPVYWKLLTRLSEDRIIDTTAFHLGRDGTLSKTAPDEGETGTELRLLTALFEDALYGEGFSRANGVGAGEEEPTPPVTSLFGEITMDNWDETAMNAALQE